MYLAHKYLSLSRIMLPFASVDIICLFNFCINVLLDSAYNEKCDYFTVTFSFLWSFFSSALILTLYDTSKYVGISTKRFFVWSIIFFEYFFELWSKNEKVGILEITPNNLKILQGFDQFIAEISIDDHFEWVRKLWNLRICLFLQLLFH